MSTFAWARLTRSALFKRHSAYALVVKDLFSSHQELVFANSIGDVDDITFADTVNALLNCFQEDGVRVLFAKPEFVAEFLLKANEFIYVSLNDREGSPFDLQTTLVVYYIQQLFPIQNNRRQARQKDIEKFLTRDLRTAWTTPFKNWLTELLLVQEYANSRWITFFRFTA